MLVVTIRDLVGLIVLALILIAGLIIFLNSLYRDWRDRK